jgi:hypothetical protein
MIILVNPYAVSVYIKPNIMKPFPFGKAVVAGLIVGTLDILAAFIQYYISTQKNPLVVLKFIASGVFGKEAFSGGDVMLFWGLLFHFTIATCFAIFFFWLVNQVPLLLRHRHICVVRYAIFGVTIGKYTQRPAQPSKGADRRRNPRWLYWDPACFSGQAWGSKERRHRYYYLTAFTHLKPEKALAAIGILIVRIGITLAVIAGKKA